MSLSLFVHASPSTQTHKIDTKGSDGLYFLLDNGCGIWFDAEYIYLGDSNGLFSWIDNNGIEFYNLKMGQSSIPNPWHIIITGPANITFAKLFEKAKLNFQLQPTLA